ncbi:NUDIX domain protein [Bacteriovorax sp. DB6_IX]|nr:NUDIX domain protein [Bacteriovorax sp. DB6_IX]
MTGSIEGDESWLAGAKRELLEETGLEGHVNQLDLTFTFHDRWNRDVEERVFVAEVFSSEVELCEAEHQDFKWIPVDEVKETHYKHKNNYESFIEAVRCLKS